MVTLRPPEDPATAGHEESAAAAITNIEIEEDRRRQMQQQDWSWSRLTGEPIVVAATEREVDEKTIEKRLNWLKEQRRKDEQRRRKKCKIMVQRQMQMEFQFEKV